MADPRGGWTTVNSLRPGAVFVRRDGSVWTRGFYRDAAGREADCLSHAHPFAASTLPADTPARPLDVPALVCENARLCALLGLSDRERAFITAALDDAADFDLYSVLADWLEEEGRTRDGARVRRLAPKDGDVLVWRAPESWSGGGLGSIREAIDRVRQHLQARGVETTSIILYGDDELSALDPERMRAAGWVRADDVRRRVDIARDDCARYLELVVDSHESEQVPLDAGALRRVAEQLRGGTP
jgi:hypothetical protein